MATTAAEAKAMVLEAFDTLFNKRDFAKAERFWSPHYIQHSAHIPPGREGLFALVKSAPANMRYENSLILAEGDVVILHGRFSNVGGPADWIVVDIVRLEGGVLAEHWDVIQDEATREQSKSGNPMFGKSFPVRVSESKSAAMRAVVFDPSAVGKAETKEFPVPTLSDDHDVLVEVYAGSLNPVDNTVMHFNPYQLKAPKALGVDFSGVVRAIGKSVDGFKVGDEVFGAFPKSGALAEFVLVDSGNIVPKPKALSWEQAAALGVVFITAAVGVDEAKIQPGETVFVPGAGGGVAHIVAQLAKLGGARVIASASNKDALAFLKDEIKLDHVFDYKVHKTVDEVNKFTAGKFADVVIDNVGGYVDVGSDTMPALHKGGRYFSLLARKVDALAGQRAAEAKGVTYKEFTVGGILSNPDRTTRTKSSASNYERAATLVTSGNLKIKISKTISLASVPAELADIFKSPNHGFGKIVVTIKA